MTYDKLLSPVALTDDLKLRNRVVMAPMTTWAANDDLTISDEEIAYYQERSHDVGMLITGCTHVLPNGIGFTSEFGAFDDRFTPSLCRLADAAKIGGATAILQIFHAGAKALPDLIPNAETVAPSAVPTGATGFAPAQTPRALTEPEIQNIIAAFGETTRRAIAAGFDGIELHGAHGFLIQNFLSPATNRRTDDWGGSAENRMRFLLAVIKEVQSIANMHSTGRFIIGLRLSPEEPGGYAIGNTFDVIDAAIDAGVTYVHASLSDALHDRPIAEAQGPTILARLVTHVAERVPLIVAGRLRNPAQAERAVTLGVTCAAVGQGLVMNPDWVQLAKTGQEDRIDVELDPQAVRLLAIPDKLWTVIEAAKGWFRIKGTEPIVGVDMVE